MNNENVQVKSMVTSYRLKEDTKEKVQQQLKELGLTQEQYFNKVVTLMELENIKQNNLLSKDTTIIQSNLDAILNSFISLADTSNNLITNKDAELIEIKNKYKDMLVEKDYCITNKNNELQQVYANLNILQIESETNKNEMQELKLENNKQLEQLASNLLDKTNLIEEYKQKNDMLLSDLSEYKQYKSENANLKQALTGAQSENIILSNSIKNKEYEVSKLNKEYNYEISKLNKVIEDLKDSNQKNMDSIEKENKLNIKIAIAETKEELNNKLELQQLKHNEEIQEYQAKYKELLEELEKVRTKKDKPAKKENSVK